MSYIKIFFLMMGLHQQEFIIQPEAPKSIVDRFMESKELQEIVYRESRGDSTVISSASCMGKFQLHPMYFNQLNIDPFKYVVNGKFTMPVKEQETVCRHFIKEQIKFMERNRIPVTTHNIYMSWFGVGYFQY
jgi:hypothetical protein